MNEPTVETLWNPPGELLEPLARGLDDFNRAAIGEYRYARLAAVARDEHGELVGGVFGDLLWDWLYIQTLWVRPEWRERRLGTALMDRIEASAVAAGVTRAHLETTSFQALEFYRKRGYEIFGTLEGKPAGATWYYLKNEHLAPGTAV